MAASVDSAVGVDGIEPALRVVEIFGPTLQGEGAHVGQAAYFLRLAGCNLSCSWCDTAFSWDPEREDPERPPTALPLATVGARLEPRWDRPDASPPVVQHLVVTGGEPLLQSDALRPLCLKLKALGWVVEVETNGTVSPAQLSGPVDSFNVSPKLANSGVAKRARIRLTVLNEFAALDNARFKFVAQGIPDLDEIAALLATLSPHVAPSRVSVMAEGADAATVVDRSRKLADATLAQGWGLSPRWHVFLWGDEQGR